MSPSHLASLTTRSHTAAPLAPFQRLTPSSALYPPTSTPTPTPARLPSLPSGVQTFGERLEGPVEEDGQRKGSVVELRARVAAGRGRHAQGTLGRWA